MAPFEMTSPYTGGNRTRDARVTLATARLQHSATTIPPCCFARDADPTAWLTLQARIRSRLHGRDTRFGGRAQARWLAARDARAITGGDGYRHAVTDAVCAGSLSGALAARAAAREG